MHPALAVLLVILVPMGVTLGILLFWRKWFHNRNRRSPLTVELLRTPGYGLWLKLEEINDDISTYLMMTVITPMTFYAAYTLRPEAPLSWVGLGIFDFAGVAMYAFFVTQLIKLVRRRHKYREAMDGEMATAQCLEPVITGGGKVFHDFQADGFNIDHVVVAPGGVFAVETKHRLKPVNFDPKKAGKVRFDGLGLQFPGWVETKPVEQARRQAQWLSKFLTKATGESVEAKPVLALPGWFVDCVGRSDVSVVNPKSAGFMLKPSNEDPMPDDRKRRICHQLERRCLKDMKSSKQSLR